MSGHGHVTPNANGTMARCGGPAICSVCAREMAVQEIRDAGEPDPEPGVALEPDTLPDPPLRASDVPALLWKEIA